MELFGSKTLGERETRDAAIAAYKAARAELERVSKRDREETDAYLAANRAVAEAEKHVPWWKR